MPREKTPEKYNGGKAVTDERVLGNRRTGAALSRSIYTQSGEWSVNQAPTHKWRDLGLVRSPEKTQVSRGDGISLK